MQNPVVYFEIGCRDKAATREFYSKLFQWKLEVMPNPATPDGTYTMINVGEGTGGGIMKQVPGGPPGCFARKT